MQLDICQRTGYRRRNLCHETFEFGIRDFIKLWTWQKIFGRRGSLGSLVLKINKEKSGITKIKWFIG